jgi:hypothetical protein
MLELVQKLCERLRLGYALHTGSVPQRRRRGEILLFKNDPDCRVFLSTDSGSTGLNLQNASVVINCDLPWNPARLEQRIARAWRKHQTRPVTVIHLVSEETIEHRMLDTLASKQALAEGVLDLRGELSDIKFKSGRQALLARLQQLMSASLSPASSEAPQRERALPADRSLAFGELARGKLGTSLLRCEERYPLQGSHSVLVVVVDRDAALWREKLLPLHEELFGKGRSDPLAPTRLEVIDRAADDALQRLIEAGVVAPATRAIRSLCSNDGEVPGPPPLSEIEKQKALAHREKASRKLKMASVLQSGDLQEEAREALLEAILFLGRALAVENRTPEPEELNDTLRAPLSLCWRETLPVIQAFASTSSSPSTPVADILQKMVES